MKNHGNINCCEQAQVPIHNPQKLSDNGKKKVVGNKRLLFSVLTSVVGANSFVVTNAQRVQDRRDVYIAKHATSSRAPTTKQTYFNCVRVSFLVNLQSTNRCGVFVTLSEYTSTNMCKNLSHKIIVLTQQISAPSMKSYFAILHKLIFSVFQFATYLLS